MLNTVASWATIISAIPVAIAASVFLFRTVPTAIHQPKGLWLCLEPAIGDPGCCVHITNYGPVEHYISRVGAMPAHLRPRWSVCTKRINPKGDLLGPLLVETASASIDRPSSRAAICYSRYRNSQMESSVVPIPRASELSSSGTAAGLRRIGQADHSPWCRTSSSATVALCSARRHESSRHHSA